MPNSDFLEAQYAYERVTSIDIDALIGTLDSALKTYGSNVDASGTNLTAVKTAFQPIATYYSKLEDANEQLQKYINKAANSISDSGPRLLNEERYTNKVHPEESVEARESSYSLIPELRVSSLPFLISVSVFMASMAVFLIFNMSGFSGQVILPPMITQWLTSPASTVPFYQNPTYLGGITLSAIVLAIAFGFLYYKAKNSNNS
jgi:hypothetical protein